MSKRRREGRRQSLVSGKKSFVLIALQRRGRSTEPPRTPCTTQDTPHFQARNSRSEVFILARSPLRTSSESDQYPSLSLRLVLPSPDWPVGGNHGISPASSSPQAPGPIAAPAPTCTSVLRRQLSYMLGNCPCVYRRALACKSYLVDELFAGFETVA